MPETLTFPGLGLEFEVSRVAFMVGNNPIYWYGIIIAAAFLTAAAYVLMRSKTFGLDGDRVMDVILGGVLLGIVGARLYYVIFRWDTYSQNPMSILNIREGGIAIYGGVIGGVLAAVLVCRLRKVKLLPMLDLASGGLLIGQAIGRWGNFVNMEAFGANTSAKWGMTSPSIEWYLRQNISELSGIGVKVDPSAPVHPTFFYESVWCLLGFLFIAWFTNRRRFDGQIGLIYLLWYGAGRFIIEGLRTDSLLLGTMRVSQVLALICVIASAIVLTGTLSKIKRANDPEFMKLYVDTDEGRAVLAGEFYKKKGEAAQKSDAGKSGEDSTEKSVDEVTTESGGKVAEPEKKEEQAGTDASDESGVSVSEDTEDDNKGAVENGENN